MLVKIVRPYGGQEGRRVKVGTIFSVDKPSGDLVVITTARWNQLRGMHLAEVFQGQDSTPAAPNAKPARQPRAKPDAPRRTVQEPDSKPRAPTARVRSRRRAQEDSPKEPRPLSRRTGSQDGSQEPPASSSVEVRQAGSVTLKQRGTRRASAGSPSTTPASPPPTPESRTSRRGSARGQTSSMPVTPDGGTDSDLSPDSAALD